MHAILRDNILVSLVEKDDFLDIVDEFHDFVEEHTSLDFDINKNNYLKKFKNKVQVIEKKIINNDYFLFNREKIEETVKHTYYLIKSELDINSITTILTSRKNLTKMMNKKIDN